MTKHRIEEHDDARRERQETSRIRRGEINADIETGCEVFTEIETALLWLCRERNLSNS